MTSPRLVAVIVEVTDLDRAARFYEDAFGVVLAPGDNDADDDPWIGGRHAEISWRDGAYLHFALFPARDGAPTRNAQLSFGVADIDAAHAKAVAAGAEVLHEPKPQPWGISARYRDLDGNLIELTQHPPR
jgi:predicted enzyme related to lactoylglutathione lyase